MEARHLIMSAVGVGVGVGLGLASGQTVGRWVGGSGGVTAERIEGELMRQVVDGRDSKVTFEEFPYYLRSGRLAEWGSRGSTTATSEEGDDEGRGRRRGSARVGFG